MTTHSTSLTPRNICRSNNHEAIPSSFPAVQAEALSAITTAGQIFSKANAVIKEDAEAFQALSRSVDDAIEKVREIRQLSEETNDKMEKFIRDEQASLHAHCAKMEILKKSSDILIKKAKEQCKESKTFGDDLRKNAYVCLGILLAILAITMIPFRSLLARLR